MPVGRVLQGAHVELVLQGDGGACPLSPGIGKLVESLRGDIALERVLGGPGLARCIPVPGDESLQVLVVLHAEIVGIHFQQLAAGVLDDILGIESRLVQVFLVERAGDTGLLQVNLGEEGFGTVVVNAAVLIGHFLRKKREGLFQGHHNVFVNIRLGGLGNRIVGVVRNEAVHVMDDGNVTEAAHQEEIGKRFPGEGFTHAHVNDSLVHAGGLLETVVNRSGVRVHAPQGITHVAQLVVGAVYRELHVGVLVPHVVVAGKTLTHAVEAADGVVPGRVVQIVHALDALVGILIEVLGIVVVLGRAVQEFLAGRSAHYQYSGQSNIFQSFFHFLFLP